MTNKYNCKQCNYETDRLFNYEKHLTTKRHIYYTNSKNSNISCEYCNKEISYKNHISRHNKICKEKIKYDLERDKKQLENKIKELEDKLYAEEQEKNKILLELKEYMQKIDKNNVIVVQNNYNIKYVENNFKSAYNYEDLMKPDLSHNEILLIEKSPVYGFYKLVKGRCIKNIDLNKRPIHLIDKSRHKYVLMSNGKWIVDYNGEIIIQGINSKLESLLLSYDMTNIVEIEKYNKIARDMLSNQNKIIDYLDDHLLLKNNAKQSIKRII